MSTTLPQYPFDPTGLAPSNRVVETQAIRSRGTFDYYFIVPRISPFYADNAVLKLYPVGTNPNNPAQGEELVEGVDYSFGYHFAQASHTIGKPVYGAITFFDRAMEGQLRMELQTLGGEWVLDDQQMTELLLNIVNNPRIATWEQVIELPHQFPVVNHDFSINDFVGMGEVVDMLEEIGKSILQKQEGGLEDHMENRNNPHRVTKEQVGLGLVDNFPTASVDEAVGGTAINRFMTPLRTRQLIDAVATAALTTHLINLNNPHQVTKAQVGLGNVQNYAVASLGEAEAGASNSRYMTPVRTREAIEAIVANAFQAHATDFDNPHRVTKAQVGLGNVANIGISTDHAAIQGTGDSGVITPRLLAMVLNETVRQDHLNHLNDLSNPHQVTAEQVNTFDKDQITAFLGNKLDINDTAANSLRVFSMDQQTFQAWIGTQSAANAGRLENKTFAEVESEILSGKVADSERLEGRTYEELIEAVNTGGLGDEITDLKDRLDDLEIGSSLQHSSGALTTVLNEEEVPVDVPEHWTLLGTIDASSEDPTASASLIISGSVPSEDHNADIRSSVLFEFGATYGSGMGTPIVVDWNGASLKVLTPRDPLFTVGFVQIGSGMHTTVEIYAKSSGPRFEYSVTELSYKRFEPSQDPVPSMLEEVLTEEPFGILYPRVFTEGTAEIEALQAFTERTDNPHQVNKVQVGLGKVDNYETATLVETLDGSSTDKFITVDLLAAKVDHELTALVDSLTIMFDDGLEIFQ